MDISFMFSDGLRLVLFLKPLQVAHNTEKKQKEQVHDYSFFDFAHAYPLFMLSVLTKDLFYYFSIYCTNLEIFIILNRNNFLVPQFEMPPVFPVVGHVRSLGCVLSSMRGTPYLQLCFLLQFRYKLMFWISIVKVKPLGFSISNRKETYIL